MIRSTRRIRLCTLLLILNLAVIWGNSLVTGADSGAMSGSVLEGLMELLHLPEEHADLFHLLVRKMAHFTEFACLGALLTWRWGLAGEYGFHLWCMPLLCGVLAAVTDETIQMFVPARGPSLTDVWIDTAGLALGISLLMTGYHLVKKHKSKN